MLKPLRIIGKEPRDLERVEPEFQNARASSKDFETRGGREAQRNSVQHLCFECVLSKNSINLWATDVSSSTMTSKKINSPLGTKSDSMPTMQRRRQGAELLL